MDPYIKFSEPERDVMLLALTYYIASEELRDLHPILQTAAVTAKDKLNQFFSTTISQP